MHTLNIKPHEAIFIGDTKTDALAAQEIGVDFIGVTYGFGFKTVSDIMEYPNIFCAVSPADIMNKLFKKFL